MKTTLIYFSGTGNSFYCAKEIAKELGETEIIPITIFNNEENIAINSEIIGFIFPVYFADLPDIFKKFIMNIVPAENQYFFTIAIETVLTAVR